MNWQLGKWSHFLLILLSHISVIIVLYYGSIFHIVSMLLIHFLNFWISGTVTYHRLLSHRSWDAPRWFEFFGTLLGVFSFTGSSITRSIIHRQHHKYSDSELDPHSPSFKSKLQLYLPMFYFSSPLDTNIVRDLLKDKFHVRIHRYYLLIILSTWGIIYFLTDFLWSLTLVLAPGTFSWLTIYLGNYLCHMGASRPLTTDRSTDSFLIVLLGFGEGWHGYHHINPTDPNLGNGNWDPGWWLIKVLQKRTKG